MVEFEDEPLYVVESKKQCLESGMDPNEIRIPKGIMSELELANKRQEYEEILQVVDFFSKKILNSLKDIPILIGVTDEKGFILDLSGDESIKFTMNQLGMKEGVQFTQEDMGTNVASLTLQQNHPVQLIGTNHYHTYLHNSACYGVPFHYTDVNDLLGTIGIMTGVVLHNPFFLLTLATVVDAIERELLLKKQNRKLHILNQIMLTKTRNAILAEEQIRHLVYYDALTELPNRKKMLEDIDILIDDKNKKFAILFLDLDKFKSANDNHGHQIGDNILKIVAMRLKKIIRSTDAISRIGGDEFIILLRNLKTSANAEKIAEAVVETLSTAFAYEENQLFIGASIGISIFPEDGIDAGTLIKKADLAMYEVKRNGGNGYKLYSSEMEEEQNASSM